MSIQISHCPSMGDNSEMIVAKFTTPILCEFPDAILVEVVQQIATRYVEEHYAEIAARLDQNAIANLAIAEAAKKIAEEIQRQPNIIREKDTRVYQRGVFGGMTRIR
jgi:hypothetical protein